MEELLNSQAFDNFVSQEFHITEGYANFDELIEFAFGEFETAVEKFEKIYGKKFEKPEDYPDDEQFFGFVSDEFDNMRGAASLEELAVWAFGSVEEAIEAFKERGANEDSVR